ncbi:HD domain-containing protein [Sporolactobacillus laevolacticus]|uniref:Hydrolase n=1 Tax=Sporolactobacillus laevolacticus DSM 442 TaxID=1395513 RepID=V6IW50_9BACL|nr:HD domain-containing protein [Sporolactobacillus laevolacticus]EST10746.1 hydrolase [Sporolactobacillus laevolacticus DSM 442]
MLKLFDYINIPRLTNDFKTDIKKMYVQNNKQNVFEHVENVAAMNVEIANMFGLDINLCEVSAYCHDIAAIIRPIDMLNYVKDQNLYLDASEEQHPFLLHQRFSAMITKEIFKINDEKILSAIMHHTTLKANPSRYDMALFVADKLAWDQGGTPPFYQIVKNSLNESLDLASLAYIDFIFTNNMILSPHKWLSDAYQWLKEYVLHNKS